MKKVSLTCTNCGKKFKRIKKHLNSRSKHYFCSNKCVGKYYSGKRNSFFTNAKIELKCWQCGKKIKKYKNYAKRHKKHFCNKECKLIYEKQNKKELPKCKDCGKKLGDYRAKRCISCERKTRRKNICVDCGKLGWSGSDRCWKCYKKWIKNPQNHHNWKGGISFEPYPTEWTEDLKESIRKRDNYVCQLCGNKSTKRELCVHHIDYDKNNLDPKNLISLCIFCHAKTNWNRRKWTEYFQVCRILE